MESLLNSREGATQGGPLSMVAYGIGIITLTKNLTAVFPDVTQTWYTDNAGALGTITNVKLYFNSLKQFGPRRKYYSKPVKLVDLSLQVFFIIYVVHIIRGIDLHGWKVHVLPCIMDVWCQVTESAPCSNDHV